MKSEARRARLRGLYAITPECADTATLVERVGEALAGGAALVQYRAKNAPRALALEQARALAGACRAANVPLIVNDSVELAAASGADGVHLGREDARVGAARRGADYVAIGSVFASATKPFARPAALASIAGARRASGLPVAAIGGITVENAPRVVQAGADLLAVIAALFEAPDIERAARAFARLYEPAASESRDARTQPRPL